MKRNDVGKTVTHTQEPEMGKGRILAVNTGKKITLVKWENGIIRKHDSRVLKLV